MSFTNELADSIRAKDKEVKTMSALPDRYEISQELVRELLHYDPETGIFRWKERSSDYFLTDSQCARWNTRYANKIAGCKNKTKDGKTYWVIAIFGVPFKAHRLAFIYMGMPFPESVDHENGNGIDNRWINLRSTTSLINSKNQKLRHDSRTGYSGVNYSSRGGKYIARIGVNYKQIFLGHFDDIKEAIAARKRAEVKYGFHKNHGSKRAL